MKEFDQIPQPPEVKRYLDAARLGQLLVGYCATCRRYHHYPRPQCPFCLGLNAEARESGGKGHIYSYSVMRRVAEPYVIAFVRLDEGPVMMTNIVRCDVDAVRIGQAVRLVAPDPQAAWPLLQFEPDAGDG